MSLSGRDWVTCLNHYLPPSERRRFRCHPLLLSHLPHRVQMPRLQCALSGLWGFTLTVQPVFGNRTIFLCAMVVVRRAEPCRNKDCHTGLWTLSQRHMQAKVWKTPSAHQRPFNEGYRFLLDVVKRYVYSRYLLGSRLVFAEYLRQVLQAGRLVLSLPSAVGELLINVTTLFRGRCCLYSTITQTSMRLLLLSALSSLPRTCHVMLLNTV